VCRVLKVFCNGILSFAAVLLYQEPDNRPVLAGILMSYQMVNINTSTVLIDFSLRRSHGLRHKAVLLSTDVS
jgi:hypothetical protein